MSGGHGVLAFGDSITDGGGESQNGVSLQSWALWLARGLGLPYTGCAVGGARAADVVSLQIPGFQHFTAIPRTRYEVGCLYIGVNDVRAFDWEPRAFAAHVGETHRFLRSRCERTLAVTAPLDLGRPRALSSSVLECNEIVRSTAAECGALVVDLSDFGARNHVMTDHVHPTALGQVAIAERALAVLAADGLPTRVHPSALIRRNTSRWTRLRDDVRYCYRHAGVSAQAAFIRAVFGPAAG